MKVFMLEAEHFSDGPRIVRLFHSAGRADQIAAELVNIQLKDAGLKPIAAEDSWRDQVNVLQDRYGAAHCYVEVQEIEIEGDPRIFSFLIAWNDNDSSEGEFSWTGEADSRDAALALAYEEMWGCTLHDEDEAFDLEDFSFGRGVVDEWHGYNPWS